MLAEPMYEFRRVKVQCPTCGTEQAVKLRVDDLVSKNGVASLVIKATCDHEFHLYLDKQFKIRGYEKIDMVVDCRPAPAIPCPEPAKSTIETAPEVASTPEAAMETNPEAARETAEEGTTEIPFEEIKAQFELRIKKINEIMINLELQNLNEVVNDVDLVKKKAKLTKIRDELEAQFNKVLQEHGVAKLDTIASSAS
nr:hypothetical protein [Candidatus Sigynarchaeota archaeon]